MTSYTRTIAEGGGGYVLSGYVSSGYVTSTTNAIDTLGRTYAGTRTITPTVTLTDAIKLGITRFITTQAQTITDALTRRIVATRELAQGVGGYTSSGYVTSGYIVDNRSLMSDTLSRVRDVPRTLTQTVTLTDAIKLGIKRMIATQTVTITQGAFERLYGAVRTAAETWTHTNSVTRVLVATRTLLETSGLITDLLVAFKGVAGTGARKIKYTTTMIFKRSSITAIFKRTGRTSA